MALENKTNDAYVTKEEVADKADVGSAYTYYPDFKSRRVLVDVDGHKSTYNSVIWRENESGVYESAYTQSELTQYFPLTDGYLSTEKAMYRSVSISADTTNTSGNPAVIQVAYNDNPITFDVVCDAGGCIAIDFGERYIDGNGELAFYGHDENTSAQEHYYFAIEISESSAAPNVIWDRLAGGDHIFKWVGGEPALQPGMHYEFSLFGGHMLWFETELFY